MKKRPSSTSLQDLEDDIQRFERKQPVEEPQPNVVSSASAAGMQIGLELVCSVGVGGVAGFFLDKWLGTLPFAMVVGLFLGAAAGVRMMIVTSRNLSGAEKNNDERKDGQT